MQSSHICFTNIGEMKNKYETEQIARIKDIPCDTYFRKIRKDGSPYGDVMTRKSYDRSYKQYEAYYESDISRNAWFNPNTLVLVGFDY